MNYRRQYSFPLKGSVWNPGEPDLTGYKVPATRSALVPPAFNAMKDGQPVVTVIGTVRNEADPLERSLAIWTKQVMADEVKAEFLVMDDGSVDDPFAVVEHYREQVEGGPFTIRYVRMREPGAEGERNCTLLFNAAVRQLVRTPLVLFQWWDRIPGSFTHLNALTARTITTAGQVTSAVSRHIGGSSSIASMEPAQLSATLALTDWRNDPTTLATIAGPIGGHCVAGEATESSGFCMPIDEFIALGGYDERYVTRANYSNVELWRRILESGLEVAFVPEPSGANYHQSHGCPTNREKDLGQLHDLRVRRNTDIEWGTLPVLEEK